MQLRLDRFDSPVGVILLVHDELDRLRALDFEDYEARMHRLLRVHYGDVALREALAPKLTTTALARYFAGDFNALATVCTATAGTRFQRAVWGALRTIPPGSTLSYGELARRLDATKAVRAVGAANGANPIALVTPCHRVIGASGSLTGFGGGLPRKQWLLEHEGARPRSAPA